MKKFFTRLFPLIAALLVASCVTTAPPRAPLPELTFSHLTPIALKVAQIEVVSEYTSPFRAPHIEHQVPLSPEKALRLWASARLKAVGGPGVARLVIKTASVKDVPLTVRPGIKGAFYKDQSDRFEAEISAALHIYEGGGASAGFAEAQSSHARTVDEAASINARTKVQFEVVEAAVSGFDQEMSKNAKVHLGRWIDNAD